VQDDVLQGAKVGRRAVPGEMQQAEHVDRIAVDLSKGTLIETAR